MRGEKNIMENLNVLNKQKIIESFIELEMLDDKLSYESEGTIEFNTLNNKYEFLYHNILYNLCLLEFNFSTCIYYKENQDKIINSYINKFSLYEPYEDDKYFHLVLHQDNFNYYQYNKYNIYIKIDVEYINESYIDEDGYEQYIETIESKFKVVEKIGEKTIPVFND